MLALRNYQNSFPHLFDELFNMGIENNHISTPIYDVIESDGDYTVKMILAGIKKEDISLNVEDGILTIKAERKNENEDKKFNRREIFYGKYEKSFTLPDNVNVDDIDASHDEGILRLKIPKLVEDSKKSRVIEIT